MKNIVLTGLMGSGKTSVGKRLADILQYDFLDTDDIIEQETGISINEIFSKYGEIWFREYENKISRKLSEVEKTVISTGGGFVLNPDNIENLRKNSIIVNLRTKAETLWNRLKTKTDRPLLKVLNPLNKLKELINERERFYNNADYIIDTDDLSVDEVVEEILNLIKEDI